MSVTKQNQKNRKRKRSVSEGIVHVKATFNNTLISITDDHGDVLCQASAGCCNFKGARKSTPFAAQQVADIVVKKAIEAFQMRRVEVRVSGSGPGRESAIRGVKNAGLQVIRLVDVTRIPHNGVRPPKKRRV